MTRAGFLSLAGIILATTAAADPLRFRFYDGDTVAPTIRLTIDGELSFDTPETAKRHGADCALEIARGRAAGKRLREIVRGADHISMRPLINAETGEIARTRDQGRLLFQMIVDGENVGRILAREGHAMLYRWKTEAIDWCATPPMKRAK